ncbi:hypothetical protein [Piscinibacter sp.]|uniref:hypothetical protein n=1 Tax=Piscinibacter sp. TaxID=1903157 RepID=UPI002F429197
MSKILGNRQARDRIDWMRNSGVRATPRRRDRPAREKVHAGAALRRCVSGRTWR